MRAKQQHAQDGDDRSNCSVKRLSTERQGKVNLCFLLPGNEEKSRRIEKYRLFSTWMLDWKRFVQPGISYCCYYTH
jgi:hypothetical protein